MIKITKQMVDAAAVVLNRRLAQNQGLAGVSRDMLEAALVFLDEGHEVRLQHLEKWAHEPFDFTDLIKRLETLERAHPGLYQKRDNPDSDYDMDRYSAR